MEQKTILLLNVVTIQLISIFSDYWISIKYRTAFPPNCLLRISSQIAHLSCGNISYTLVHQHANLFRQCNDISEGHRRNLSRGGLLLFADNCHWILPFRSHLSREQRIQMNFVLDLVAFLLSIISPIYVMQSYFFSKNAEGVIRGLMVSTLSALIPVIKTMLEIYYANTKEYANEEHFLYYKEADWSLFCATLSCILSKLMINCS